MTAEPIGDRAALRRLMGSHIPSQRPEPEEDHPAAVRALQLHGAVHARDQERMVALGGSWSVLELWEAAIALAAMVPAGVDAVEALAWLE